MIAYGADDKKWVIRRGFLGNWLVWPPRGSFWGVNSMHRTFNEARLDFIRQTAHVRWADA